MLQVRRMVVSVNLKREKVILVYVKKLICMISECTVLSTSGFAAEGHNSASAVATSYYLRGVVHL